MKISSRAIPGGLAGHGLSTTALRHVRTHAQSNILHIKYAEKTGD